MMAIPYVEVIEKYSRLAVAVVEPSQCWFELSYYDLGEFEVYCRASDVALRSLVEGNYVRIPNRPYLWVIRSVEYTYSADGARMVDAKGYEAKCLLAQRIIPVPWQLDSDLAYSVKALADVNCGLGASPHREIIGLKIDDPDFSITIDDTIADRGNLWSFLSGLLKAYHCGSYLYYDDAHWLRWKAFQGVDRSAKMVFSQSMDNLIKATYFKNASDVANYIQIVSKQSEDGQTSECVSEYPDAGASHPHTGIDRFEMSIEDNLSTKYVDEQGVERETAFGSELYRSWQTEDGKSRLAEKKAVVDFSGEIDLAHSHFEFDEDFFIGDIVKVKDEHFGYSANARIVKYTFKQDEKGYGEEAEYGE